MAANSATHGALPDRLGRDVHGRAEPVGARGGARDARTRGAIGVLDRPHPTGFPYERSKRSLGLGGYWVQLVLSRTRVM